MANAWLADLVAPETVPNARSISEIQTFARCPARWHYKFVERLPDPPGPEAQWGIAFHQCAEAYYTGAALPPVPDDVRHAWALFEREIASHIRPLPGWTERWVTYQLAGVTFTGRIDCVDDQLTIRDVKTRGRRPSEDEILHDWQLTAYFAAVWQVLGQRPKAVAWDVYVRLKQPVATTALADRTPQDIARLERIVERIGTLQEQGHIYPAWGSLGCGNCPFRERCIQDWGRPKEDA